MRLRHSFLLPLFASAAVSAAPAARAQVAKELPPAELEYVILHGDPLEPSGTAHLSFRPVDTARGRQLEIRAHVQYTIPPKGDPSSDPLVYEEESTVFCDGEGVVRFDTRATALGEERKNVGLRTGDTYQITTTFEGKKRSYAISAEVRRSNFALFCGGYLEERLDGGEPFEDFPMLYPVGGDHKARQRFREAEFPFEIGPKTSVPTVISRIEKKDKSHDRIWNAVAGPQILLRMEESTNFGPMVYELRTVNGVPAAESGLLR